MCVVFIFSLGLTNSFDQQAKGAVLDLTGDDNDEMKRSQNQLKWWVDAYRGSGLTLELRHPS